MMIWKQAGQQWRWLLTVAIVSFAAVGSWLVLTGETGSPTPAPTLDSR